MPRQDWCKQDGRHWEFDSSVTGGLTPSSRTELACLDEMISQERPLQGRRN